MPGVIPVAPNAIINSVLQQAMNILKPAPKSSKPRNDSAVIKEFASTMMGGTFELKNGSIKYKQPTENKVKKALLQQVQTRSAADWIRDFKIWGRSGGEAAAFQDVARKVMGKGYDYMRFNNATGNFMLTGDGEKLQNAIGEFVPGFVLQKFADMSSTQSTLEHITHAYSRFGTTADALYQTLMLPVYALLARPELVSHSPDPKRVIAQLNARKGPNRTSPSSEDGKHQRNLRGLLELISTHDRLVPRMGGRRKNQLTPVELVQHDRTLDAIKKEARGVDEDLDAWLTAVRRIRAGQTDFRKAYDSLYKMTGREVQMAPSTQLETLLTQFEQEPSVESLTAAYAALADVMSVYKDAIAEVEKKILDGRAAAAAALAAGDGKKRPALTAPVSPDTVEKTMREVKTVDAATQHDMAEMRTVEAEVQAQVQTVERALSAGPIVEAVVPRARWGRYIMGGLVGILLATAAFSAHAAQPGPPTVALTGTSTDVAPFMSAPLPVTYQPLTYTSPPPASPLTVTYNNTPSYSPSYEPSYEPPTPYSQEPMYISPQPAAPSRAGWYAGAIGAGAAGAAGYGLAAGRRRDEISTSGSGTVAQRNHGQNQGQNRKQRRHRPDPILKDWMDQPRQLRRR